MRLSRDGFISEIILGRETGLYHYVVTKKDSPAILTWGQENTLSAARKCIDDFIDHEIKRKRTAC